MEKTKSLKRKFLFRILAVLLVIVVISGFIQLFFIKQQIASNVENQAGLVSNNILDGISKTEFASQSIEHQIDLKMIGYSKNISLMLKSKTLDKITQDDLIQIRDELGIQGITLFARKGDDIVGVKATDPNEIDFSFRKFGPSAYVPIDDVLKGERIPRAGEGSYKAKNMIVLPISQSGSHGKEPVFFKYAYYHEPGTNYIINPYIEENQVYKFTKEVGPDSQIKSILKSNHNVLDIAVLNPRSFSDNQRLYI